VSQYQKGKTNLDFTEARDSERQWHQLGHLQVCTSLQTDNHASTSPLVFFTGRMPFLPPNQQRQSTEGSGNMQKYGTELLETNYPSRSTGVRTYAWCHFVGNQMVEVKKPNRNFTFSSSSSDNGADSVPSNIAPRYFNDFCGF